MKWHLEYQKVYFFYNSLSVSSHTTCFLGQGNFISYYHAQRLCFLDRCVRKQSAGAPLWDLDIRSPDGKVKPTNFHVPFLHFLSKSTREYLCPSFSLLFVYPECSKRIHGRNIKILKPRDTGLTAPTTTAIRQLELQFIVVVAVVTERIQQELGRYPRDRETHR